jgi:hypothetical protein
MEEVYLGYCNLCKTDVPLARQGELAFHAKRELPLRRGNRLFLPMPEGRGFSAVSVSTEVSLALMGPMRDEDASYHAAHP